MEILMFNFLSIIKVACLLQGRNDFGRASILSYQHCYLQSSYVAEGEMCFSPTFRRDWLSLLLHPHMCKQMDIVSVSICQERYLSNQDRSSWCKTTASVRKYLSNQKIFHVPKVKSVLFTFIASCFLLLTPPLLVPLQLSITCSVQQTVMQSRCSRVNTL